MESSCSRRSASEVSYRKQFAKRFACFIVAGVLLLGMVEPTRARAAASVSALYQITAAFLASCGLSWGVDGMNGSGFTDEVGRLLQDYLDTEFAGQTPLEWSAGIACAVTGTGKLTIPKVLAEKMAAFATWVVGKFGITAGSTATVYAGAASAKLADGTTVSLSPFQNSDPNAFIPTGTIFKAESIPAYYDARFPCGAGFVFDASSGSSLNMYNISGPFSYSSLQEPWFVSYALDTETNEIYIVMGVPMVYGLGATLRFDMSVSASQLNIVYPNVAIRAGDIAIPNAGAMTEDEELAIGTGIAATTLDGLLAAILEAILAGNLSATQEITKAEEETETAEKVGDISIADIQAQQATLGAIFISKFPFSIPWDVFAAVKLLAAPPVKPVWEVDLLKPVAHKFGGFKGDTTIVIDLTEYPVIGQFSRWFTTLLFCWALMLGTKRLIWTA